VDFEEDFEEDFKARDRTGSKKQLLNYSTGLLPSA
jgi:hypothetical protein